jgi:hypothetical protein
MRGLRSAGAVFVSLAVAGVSWIGPGTTAGAAAARPAVAGTGAVTSDVLYVSNASGCSDSAGLGSALVPFCTISAAAAAVQPGQTVMVEPGQYPEVVHITRSGTADAPITFQGVPSQYTDQVDVYVNTGVGAVIDVSGAQHVVIKGFDAEGGISVDSSSDITLDSDVAVGPYASPPAIRVTGASTGVSVTRTTVETWEGTGIQVDGGSTGTVLASDQVTGTKAGTVGVSLQGATGTDIVGDTVVDLCGGGIDAESGSTGTTMENDIVETGYTGKLVADPVTFTACTSPGTARALTVSADSADGTTEDHDLIDPVSGGTPYTWAGTRYTDLSAYQASTGQGAYDLATDPQLDSTQAPVIPVYSPAVGSPAIDAADASAPGETATDSQGMPRTDDPDVTDSGTGGVGWFDLGAGEREGGTVPGGQGGVTVTTGALSVTASYTHPTFAWTTNRPDTRTVIYKFGDSKEYIASAASSVTHDLARSGTYNLYYSGSGFEGDHTYVVGADYTPVPPDRLLDTRNAIGTTTTTPVAAGADVVLRLPTLDGVSGGAMSAVVANVTVTQPSASGYVTVYPDGTDRPTSSNLNFAKGKTVANLVTSAVTDGSLRLYNGSSGTVHLIVDLEGFYAPGGSGYQTVAPARVLDTRTGQGTSGASALAAHGTLRLDLSGVLPSSTTAAVLNLTATQPTTSGYLTAYPDGTARPTASNLNFAAGQTVPNLVVVPVTGGVADIYNGGSGPVQVIADLDGSYGSAASGASLAFVPRGPLRIDDTRVNGNQDYPGVPAHGTLIAAPIQYTGSAPYAAAVLNVTVTKPQTNGYLTAYPNRTSRPAVSNLNFAQDETVANLASIGGNNGMGVAIYNGSSGTVQIIVDQEGYFVPAQ